MMEGRANALKREEDEMEQRQRVIRNPKASEWSGQSGKDRKMVTITKSTQLPSL